ncbi:hypothetical protein FRB99_000017 [Tulasnella sp. 403]|nr:hypothetical protein FRB99_000017 [Tulasnella sp. 403]
MSADPPLLGSRRPSTSSGTPRNLSSPNSPLLHQPPTQPLPPLPPGAVHNHPHRPSLGHIARSLSSSHRTLASASDFDSPRIPYLQHPADSPDDGSLMLKDDDEVDGSANGGPSGSSLAAGSSGFTGSQPGNSQLLQHSSSTPRKTSGGSVTGSVPNPHVMQHHPSQSNSLKTMNSQSSLAGLPTRTTRHNQVVGDMTPRSSSRAASRQPSGNGPSPSNGAGAATGNGTLAAGNTKGTGAIDKDKEKDATNGTTGEREKGNPTPKPSKDSQQASSRVAKEKTSGNPSQLGHHQRIKFRHTPHLPHYEAERVPAAMMHWSKAPVHGALPTRSMRAHTVTMVDHMAWVFGGCDDRGCWRDVWCFDIETFQWSHPEMLGELPPPCRAHTATLVDRKIYVFGGGEGPTYYNDLYILDTVSHRWHKPNIPAPHPLPRRAHTAVLYRDTIYIFGGGNGHRALNDVWALDVSVGPDKLRWEQIHAHGQKPGARGYHTANLVGEVMVVLGGSDGRECFQDVWVLDLEKLVWREVKPDKTYRRLSHSSTQVGSYLFVMGGHDGNKYSHELLLFNLVTLQFEPRQTQGRPPSSRGYHVTTLADSRLWVFGGFDGHIVFDDVWVLDLAAAAYLPQVTSFGIFVDGRLPFPSFLHTQPLIELPLLTPVPDFDMGRAEVTRHRAHNAREASMPYSKRSFDPDPSPAAEEMYTMPDPPPFRVNIPANRGNFSGQLNLLPENSDTTYSLEPDEYGSYPGFPSVAEYEEIQDMYLQGLSARKQEKALITQSMYDAIHAVLRDPSNTEIGSPQFRYWVRKMFVLACFQGEYTVTHEDKPVASKEQIYQILVHCHGECYHGGRDKTCNQIKQYYSWIPKEIVAQFVKACPTCVLKRSNNPRKFVAMLRDIGGNNTAVTEDAYAGYLSSPGRPRIVPPSSQRFGKLDKMNVSPSRIEGSSNDGLREAVSFSVPGAGSELDQAWPVAQMSAQSTAHGGNYSVNDARLDHLRVANLSVPTFDNAHWHPALPPSVHVTDQGVTYTMGHSMSAPGAPQTTPTRPPLSSRSTTPSYDPYGFPNTFASRTHPSLEAGPLHHAFDIAKNGSLIREGEDQRDVIPAYGSQEIKVEVFAVDVKDQGQGTGDYSNRSPESTFSTPTRPPGSAHRRPAAPAPLNLFSSNFSNYRGAPSLLSASTSVGGYASAPASATGQVFPGDEMSVALSSVPLSAASTSFASQLDKLSLDLTASYDENCGLDLLSAASLAHHAASLPQQLPAVQTVEDDKSPVESESGFTGHQSLIDGTELSPEALTFSIAYPEEGEEDGSEITPLDDGAPATYLLKFNTVQHDVVQGIHVVS